MRSHIKLLWLWICFFFLFVPQLNAAQGTACPGPLRFRITLAPKIASKAITGRLLIFLTGSGRKRDILATGFVPDDTWVAATEITDFVPGSTIDFDPDLIAFPHPFSQVKPGRYQLMALLDPHHSFAYRGLDGSDLLSRVIEVENLNPANTQPIGLTLNRVAPARTDMTNMKDVKVEEFTSHLLSAFWGRPIHMRAAVVLPPDYNNARQSYYPAIYFIHAFGADHIDALRNTRGLLEAIAEGKQQMVYVFLDASFSSGYTFFVDSVNNGPWGRALTEEFIPHLEKEFRLIAKPSARFLTGHSSGGWSSLWLQVTYPDFFGGTWSTAPDPVDFRAFNGMNATPGSIDNAYRRRDGQTNYLMLQNGKDVIRFEDFIKLQMVTSEYGGVYASFESAWSPRGPDGRPMELFDRTTGALDPAVLQAWQRYDIRSILESHWATLEPQLKGKIHVFCGGADTFHLDEAVKLLCEMFKRKNADAVCEIVPERDHFNLYKPFQTYPGGLAVRIYKEIWEKYKTWSGAHVARNNLLHHGVPAR